MALTTQQLQQIGVFLYTTTSEKEEAAAGSGLVWLGQFVTRSNAAQKAIVVAWINARRAAITEDRDNLPTFVASQEAIYDEQVQRLNEIEAGL